MNSFVDDITVLERAGGKVAWVLASGKLTSDSYQEVAPAVDRIASKHRQIRLVYELRNYTGQTFGAIWEDLKLFLRHHNRLDRVAIVTDRQSRPAIAKIARPAPNTTLRTFNALEAKEAESWAFEGLSTSPS